MMVELSVLTDEFLNAVAKACLQARESALKAGLPIVYRDAQGRFVAEHPEGRRFEVRFDPTRTRDSHLIVLRELPADTAA